LNIYTLEKTEGAFKTGQSRDKRHIVHQTTTENEDKNYTIIVMIIIYNYGLHEKLISIIIKLRKVYFPEVLWTSGK
jgi:hypothetical protein